MVIPVLLKAGDVRYAIQVTKSGRRWSAIVLYEGYSPGLRFCYWTKSCVPGDFTSEAECVRAAHLQAVAQLLGDLGALRSFH